MLHLEEKSMYCTEITYLSPTYRLLIAYLSPTRDNEEEERGELRGEVESGELRVES